MSICFRRRVSSGPSARKPSSENSAKNGSGVGADSAEVLAGGGWQPDELSRADASMPAAAFLREHHAHLAVLHALRTTYAGEVDVVHNNSLHYLPLSLSTSLTA